MHTHRRKSGNGSMPGSPRHQIGPAPRLFARLGASRQRRRRVGAVDIVSGQAGPETDVAGGVDVGVEVQPAGTADQAGLGDPVGAVAVAAARTGSRGVGRGARTRLVYWPLPSCRRSCGPGDPNRPRQELLGPSLAVAARLRCRGLGWIDPSSLRRVGRCGLSGSWLRRSRHSLSVASTARQIA
jgi:hypothetical protein